MMRKISAVLLALVLFAAATPTFARAENGGWLIYCADTGPSSFDVTVVAPAKYTRLSDAPGLETIFTTDRTESRVLTPTAEQIAFYTDGKTERRWALTVSCTEPSGEYSFRCAVTPGSVLDTAGNGNARVFFDDETEYMRAAGYAEIDVYSGLLRRDYSRDADTVAVGDTLRVDYSGLYPIEVFINGEKAVALPGGELESCSWRVSETGALDVVVRQYGEEAAARTLDVVTSAEMYRRNLLDGLITGEDIPGSADLIDVGIPAGSPFILIAKLVAFFSAFINLLYRLFSFTRIPG